MTARASLSAALAGAIVGLAAPLFVGCATTRPALAAAPVRPARNKPPDRLCAREAKNLLDDVPGAGMSEDDAAPPVGPPSRPLPALARHRVILDDRLPPSYAIVALAVPTSSGRVRIDDPSPGALGEIDGRGARGEVAVVVRVKRTGGLYDYVGDCELARDFIDADPQVLRVAPKTTADVRVVVELVDGRPSVHVDGLPMVPVRTLGLRFDY